MAALKESLIFTLLPKSDMVKSMQSISFASILKVALVVIGLIFLYLTKEILVILFLAVIIASAVSPAVSFLEKYYIPRALGTLFVYVFVLAF